MLLTALLLTACADSGEPSMAPSQSFTLTQVLPNPAEVGGDFTVYGRFPTDPALRLSGQGATYTLTPRVGVGVLTASVPAAAVAGRYTLALTAGGGTLSLALAPKLTAVAQGEPGHLRLSGRGWTAAGALASGTSVLVDGAPTSVQLTGGDLDATLPTGVGYGQLDVQVVVNAVGSAVLHTVLQAASVTGQLGAPPQLTAQAARVPDTPPGPALLVQGALPNPAFPGLTRAEDLPELNRTRLRFADTAHAAHAARVLQAQGRATEYDAAIHLDAQASRTTGDPSALGAQWFWPLLALPDADASPNGAGVTVAVLDTGVAPDHPDLQAQLLPGWNFVTGGSDTSDHVGHGTHVAGLIAARGRVRGAAPGAKLLPVKVLDDGAGDASTVAQGVLWAAGLDASHPNPHPAQVLNLSLGTGTTSTALTDAIGRARAHGVIVVVAGGNNGGPLAFPASLPDVLSVTAVAGPQDLYHPEYANSGATLKLSAYGGDLGADQNRDGVPDGILSTDVDELGSPTYGLRNGTSMAAPQVSGLVARALSAGLPAATLPVLLTHGAVDLGPLGPDPQFGFGLLTARATQPATPRAAAFAVRDGAVVAFAPVPPDGRFRLNGVPPQSPVSVIVATDVDGNGRYGEPGEARSAPQGLTLGAGEVRALGNVPLTIAPPDASALTPPQEP